MEYPGLDVREYLGRLDDLAARARAFARVPARSRFRRTPAPGVGACPEQAGDPLRRLHRLREFLFEEQGFRGNVEDYYDPRNSFFNDVLDRRLGIPITLSLLFVEVGRRLGLAIDGIGLPGHFIVGFDAGECRVLLDPFDGGAVLTPEGCQRLVARALGRTVRLQDQHFAVVTKRQFLIRMLDNLKGIYFKREAWDKALWVCDRLVVLDPENSCEVRDRGVALVSMGELPRAAADWESYLRHRPEAPDAESVRARLRRVRQALAALN